MRRSSLRYPAKLLISFNSNPNSTYSFSKNPSFYNGLGRSFYCSKSCSTGAGSASSTCALKTGTQKPDVSWSAGFSSSTAVIDAPTVAAAPAIRARNALDLARHYGRCYWELSKARLSMLVVATSGTGYVLGSGNAIDYVGLCCTCAGTMMVAASANSLNQIFEINNDAKMKRTSQRPLPSGRLTVPHAVAWASSVGVAGTALLACQANIMAAGLAASNLILYAFVYTPLKQIHPVNTWVGALVGAIPPLLGWVAAAGQISFDGMVLPAALYFWQIPHFMALAYLCRDDYAAGGFKMFSLADASGRRTALVALRNCLYLLPLGYLAYDWGLTSWWFGLESTLLACAFAASAFSFYRNPGIKDARRMFHASLLYLPVFMSAMLFHRLPNQLLFDEEDTNETQQPLSLLENPEEEDVDSGKPAKDKAPQIRPPVAYASVAPFPFLPAPSCSYRYS